jgi:hypothetical protein
MSEHPFRPLYVEAEASELAAARETNRRIREVERRRDSTLGRQLAARFALITAVGHTAETPRYIAHDLNPYL